MTPAASSRPCPRTPRSRCYASPRRALVNAAKHAAGQPVAVRLDYGDAGIQLTVRNDLPPGANTRQYEARRPAPSTAATGLPACTENGSGC